MIVNPYCYKKMRIAMLDISSKSKTLAATRVSIFRFMALAFNV